MEELEIALTTGESVLLVRVALDSFGETLAVFGTHLLESILILGLGGSGNAGCHELMDFRVSQPWKH